MTIRTIIKEAMERQPIAIKEALEEELRIRVARAIHEKMETIDEGHGVFMKGGSVGSKTDPSKPFKVHDTLEAAKAHAKRLNAQLTPGEKQHYGIKYHVKPVSEGYVVEQVEDLDEVEGSPKRNRELYTAGRINKDEFDRRMERGKYKPKGDSNGGAGRLLGQKVYKNLVKSAVRTEEVEDLDEAAEPGSIKDGYYVTCNGKLSHDKSFPDSKTAISHADKKETETGKIHRVHHVKAGKIHNQWEYDGGNIDASWKPFTDFRGEHAHYHIMGAPKHLRHPEE